MVRSLRKRETRLTECANVDQTENPPAFVAGFIKLGVTKAIPARNAKRRVKVPESSTYRAVETKSRTPISCADVMVVGIKQRLNF
jgi:hypothetical protein